MVTYSPALREPVSYIAFYLKIQAPSSLQRRRCRDRQALMEFVHFLSIIVSDRIFNTSCLRKADDCCQGQGAGQSCRYQLGRSRGRAAPQPCPGAPRFTGNTCHRGLTVPSPLPHAGGRALENALRLERSRGPAPLCSPRSACAFWRCTEMRDFGHQRSDNTCSQRRREAQLKW